MTTQQTNEEVIFNTARKIDSAEAREEYLAQVCAGDLDLRNRVEALLQSQAAESQFLESPALDPTCAAATIREQPGTQVGRYKLLQKIGEGGFGVVYMAEQAKPVRRKVALKIIKAGMDTKEVIARFEAERQALALMEHPNIARVLDGGSTESGRPYFVMELVKGVPLTQFCDENQLETVERLRLFQVVCKAIQHAHHKGIIHRDIKPSNVMVTLHDGEPIVKVIDFGVSKAISQQLTEKTMFTAYGQMIGTPQYMSPEQAEMSGLDIDTRSDIYSLGVLLYELLTGSTPIKPERLRQTGYAEMQRMIREEEPPRPSVRFSTLGEQSATVATKRNSDVKKLGKLLRGELDWIVMKALEKNRDRRYETANAMADDVNRFLIGESIAACPPSMTYRFQKFTRRNRVAFLTLGSILTILLGASIVSTVLAVRATAAERVAKTNLENFLSEQKKVADANAKFIAARGREAIQNALAQLFSGNYEEAQHHIELAETYGASAGELAMCRGILARETGQETLAKEHFEVAVEKLPNSMAAKMLLRTSASFLGDDDLRTKLVEQLVDMTPESPTDLLYASLTYAHSNNEQAIEWLEQLKTTHNSPLVYYHMGRTYFVRAYETYELSDIEQMLDLVDVAYFTMPKNEFAPRRYVQAHVMAADAYRISGNPAVSQYHLQKAEQAAEQLVLQNPQASRSHQAMMEVHAYKDEWDQARKHARLANEFRTTRDETCSTLAFDLPRRSRHRTGFRVTLSQ